jgi:hypothetical protein
MRKRGFSEVINIILIIMICIAFAATVFLIINTMTRKQTEISQIKVNLLEERAQIRNAKLDPLNNSKINITICCASGISGLNITSQKEVNFLDIALVTDRSGSMRQSGWTLSISGNFTSLKNYTNISVPRDSYSTTYSFNITNGTLRVLNFPLI